MCLHQYQPLQSSPNPLKNQDPPSVTHLSFQRSWTGTWHLLHQPRHFTYLPPWVPCGRTQVAWGSSFHGLLFCISPWDGGTNMTPSGQPASRCSSLVLETLVNFISTENCPLLLPVTNGFPSPTIKIGQDETGMPQAAACSHLSCQALTGHSAWLLKPAWKVTMTVDSRRLGHVV